MRRTIAALLCLGFVVGAGCSSGGSIGLIPDDDQTPPGNGEQAPDNDQAAPGNGQQPPNENGTGGTNSGGDPCAGLCRFVAEVCPDGAGTCAALCPFVGARCAAEISAYLGCIRAASNLECSGNDNPLPRAEGCEDARDAVGQCSEGGQGGQGGSSGEGGAGGDGATGGEGGVGGTGGDAGSAGMGGSEAGACANPDCSGCADACTGCLCTNQDPQLCTVECTPSDAGLG